MCPEEEGLATPLFKGILDENKEVECRDMTKGKTLTLEENVLTTTAIQWPVLLAHKCPVDESILEIVENELAMDLAEMIVNGSLNYISCSKTFYHL